MSVSVNSKPSAILCARGLSDVRERITSKTEAELAAFWPFPKEKSPPSSLYGPRKKRDLKETAGFPKAFEPSSFLLSGILG